jgi:hypothetical protein
MALKSKANRETAAGHPDVARAWSELRREEMKRLNLDIPADMHRQLKAVASSKGVTIRDLLMPVIHDLLK